LRYRLVDPTGEEIQESQNYKRKEITMKKNICFDVVLARSLEAILHSRWLNPKSKFPAGAGPYPEGTFGELGKPRRIVGAPASKTNSYHLKLRHLKRHIGDTLGALLIPLVFSGWAFANHERFNAPEDWTQGRPFYGTRGTFFADVTGPTRTDSQGKEQSCYPLDDYCKSKADAIVVNDNTITVRPSNGSSFGPGKTWATYSGTRRIFFADVDGDKDKKADFIVVNDDTNTVTVRLSEGSRFGPEKNWIGGPTIASWGGSPLPTSLVTARPTSSGSTTQSR
jgi:hypothetical protein